VAWIIGWDLILEYGIAVAAVAVGWGGNLNEFLDTGFGIRVPTRWPPPRRKAGPSTCPRC
jgi:APA family basic amino acid/polyamine antiporter